MERRRADPAGGERFDPAMHEHAGEVPELAATLRFRFDMLKELA
ncbi:hypothetical protein GCM10027612_63860 [Microbispora bryophytorum subsp. camponoti]